MDRVNFFGLQLKQADIPSLGAEGGMALSDDHNNNAEGGRLFFPIHPYYAYLA